MGVVLFNRMVKDSSSAKLLLNNIFHSLSDPTRRKILERLTAGPLTISEIKAPFKVSLVAISKHLKVLERARLIRRQKMGREHMIRLHPQPRQQRVAHKHQRKLNAHMQKENPLYTVPLDCPRIPHLLYHITTEQTWYIFFILRTA